MEVHEVGVKVGIVEKSGEEVEVQLLTDMHYI